MPVRAAHRIRVLRDTAIRDRVLRDMRYKVYLDTLKQIHRIFDLQEDPREKVNLVSKPGMAEVLDRFEKYVKDLPDEDRHPDYLKLDTSIYDVPPEYLEQAHRRLMGKNNMSPPVK